MMLINVEMDSYIQGKRSKKKYTKRFKVKESLWSDLVRFAEKDDLCSRGKYDWNRNVLYLVKIEQLEDLLKRECESACELELYDDFKKQLYGANVIIEKTYVDYTFTRKVERIDSFGFAYFLKNTGDDFFKVKISDQLRNILDVGDLAEVSVLANERWIVTDRVDQEDSQDLEEQVDPFESLLGGY